MIYKVKIDDEVFEVEITELHTRPIVAKVDGVEVEVWPEAVASLPAPAPGRPEAPAKTAARPAIPVQKAPDDLARVLRAPIPGVLVSVSVQPGAMLSPGQEVCTLEAMKMKNVIRSSRSGRVAAVKVHVGQHVKHHDVLIEYEE
jgi:biotin carboxyl carrier protein